MNNEQGKNKNVNLNSPKLDSDGVKKSGEFVEMDDFSRRRFLKVMGAGVALTGAGVSCRQPEHKILPYAKMPEMLIPGVPKFFASSLQLAGFARPVLVETHEHRPTKLEGNPEHPQSSGATDKFTQAAVLDLYDPDRSKSVLSGGSASSWKNFANFSKANLKALEEKQGEGLVFLSESNSSGTYYSLRQEILKKFPKAKWFNYDALVNDSYLKASQRVFGKFTQVQYDFTKADVVLSIDSNFFESLNGGVKNSRDYASRRRNDGKLPMNRLYVVESEYSNTGAGADHRLLIDPSALEAFIGALASEILPVLSLNADVEAMLAKAKGSFDPKFMKALVKNLKSRQGKSIVVAGDHLSADAHSLVSLINLALGNIGSTVKVTDTFPGRSISSDDLKAFAKLVEAAKVSDLVMVGGNPVFDAPADLKFAKLLKKIKNSVHLSYYQNETSKLSKWHVNRTHDLEQWDDARSYDGLVTLTQPMIRPLHSGKSANEFLASFLGDFEAKGFDLVRNTLAGGAVDAAFSKKWHDYLYVGFVRGTEFKAGNFSIDHNTVLKVSLPGLTKPVNASKDALNVVLKADEHVLDGRFANNGWLQELPRTATKLTWDNAAMLSPATAKALDVKSEDLVTITANKQSVEVAALIVPGMADNMVSLRYGYGTTLGQVATGTGFNTYPLRTLDSGSFISGAKLAKSGKEYKLATVQMKWDVESTDMAQDGIQGRLKELVRSATPQQLAKDKEYVSKMATPSPPLKSIFTETADYSTGHQWGMAIDLSTCTGCNVCTIACQAENNIPTVGKESVLVSRELHWIRLDRYFDATEDVQNPKMKFLPMTCLQCENAPCEAVCPVNATVHGPEGTNDMVYNRCIGTRYCLNNCPVKVRRFNFFNYANLQEKRTTALANPDVTVRFRGVMEKCTYCTQRISAAKIKAKVDNRRKVRDGEIQVACEQACPTNAITFGDINDKNSRVSKLKAEDRDYGILEFLNIKPRTSYLAELKNPNPELA